MKKPTVLFLVLLCVWMMVVPVFADVIVPSSPVTIPASDTEPAAAEAASAPSSGEETSGAPFSGIDPTVLCVVIGVLVAAVALLLFLLLRKAKK